MTIWESSAPSNIALIKYMGKLDHYRNLPLNPSLSYTLPHFTSCVQLKKTDDREDNWFALSRAGFLAPNLSLQGKLRFLEHLKRIKAKLNATEYTFEVRSANNFPTACGLASSAASFAALTQVACKAIADITQTKPLSTHEQTALSRRGSGSSCRSFFPSWAVWHGEYASPINLPFKSLKHVTILIEETEKTVSSSDAHRAVRLSPHYSERATRANKRLEALLTAMHTQDWRSCYQIVWDEFMDMHSLFETANPRIQYRNDAVDVALAQLQQYWQKHKDGPLVTMDAGPNIHLLFRDDQDDVYTALTAELKSQFRLLESN